MKQGKYGRFKTQARKRRQRIKRLAEQFPNKTVARMMHISEARVSQIVNGK